MTAKYILNYEADGISHRLHIEDFGDAIFCEGRVFLKERIVHYINTAPGQCWGEYIDVAPFSFVDGQFYPKATQLCIDDADINHSIVHIESTDPLVLRCQYHVGLDSSAEASHITQGAPFPLTCSPVWGGGHINGFDETCRILLIPHEFKGKKVKRVDFRKCDMENVETLIISEGVEEIALDLSNAYALERFYIPNSAKLLSPLDGIHITPWFKCKKSEPLIIKGCYCGTPGGGSGAQRSLEIPEGTKWVAAGADYNCYWHSIKTPSTLISIGRMAFCNCYCLEILNLSEGLTRIEYGAFSCLDRLKNLYLPSSLKTQEDMCFSHLPLIQEISIPSKELAENFPLGKLILRSGKIVKILRDAPDILIPLADRAVAYPPDAPFMAAGKCYENLAQLSPHRLDWEEFSYLDVHGRKTWLLISYDDGYCGTIREARYIKEDGIVTQIQKLVDGTVLVREGIGILDVPHALRNLAASFVFQFDPRQ